MKTYYLIILILGVSLHGISQSLLNSGATIKIPAGTGLYVGGNFINQANGTIELDGMLTVSGSITNSATMNINNGASMIENEWAANTGTVNIKKQLLKDRYYYVSSPIVDAKSGVFANAYLNKWDEATSAWNAMISGENVDVMKGYAVKYMADQTISFVGTPNSGTKNLPTNKSGSGWILMGNPYPSSIDWQNAGFTRNQVDKPLYFWNGTTYATYLVDGATNNATQYIAPMQAFFVRSLNTISSVTVSNAARLHKTGQVFYKGKEAQNNILLRITANNMTDEACLVFNSLAAEAYEQGTDALKLFSPLTEAPQLYSYSSDFQQLAINCMQTQNDDMIIPLGLVNGGNKELSISLEKMELASQPTVYLNDLKTSKSINLSAVKTYTFSSEANDLSNRFTLSFKAIATGIADADAGKIRIYGQNKKVIVDYLAADPEKVNVCVYDVLGKLLINQKLTGTHTQISVNKSTGMFIVKLTGNNKIKTEKVVLEE